MRCIVLLPIVVHFLMHNLWLWRVDLDWEPLGTIIARFYDYTKPMQIEEPYTPSTDYTTALNLWLESIRQYIAEERPITEINKLHADFATQFTSDFPNEWITSEVQDIVLGIESLINDYEESTIFIEIERDYQHIYEQSIAIEDSLRKLEQEFTSLQGLTPAEEWKYIRYGQSLDDYTEYC